MKLCCYRCTMWIWKVFLPISSLEKSTCYSETYKYLSALMVPIKPSIPLRLLNWMVITSLLFLVWRMQSLFSKKEEEENSDLFDHRTVSIFPQSIFNELWSREDDSISESCSCICELCSQTVFLSPCNDLHDRFLQIFFRCHSIQNDFMKCFSWKNSELHYYCYYYY